MTQRRGDALKGCLNEALVDKAIVRVRSTPNRVHVVSMLETSTINLGISLYRLYAALLSSNVDSVSLPLR